MAQESKKAVVAAIIGNVAIAAIKFVAGAMTGSSAMISEGIHSVVDTGNGGLLYYGLNRGARPADDHHPFGHGMEVYFWSLIVAVSIFGIGGGMSIYEGITHIRHPVAAREPDHQLHRAGPGGASSRASPSASPGGRSAGRSGAGARRSRRSTTARTRACSPSSSRTRRRCWAWRSRSSASSSATCSTRRASTASRRSSSAASWSSRRSGSPTRAGACWWVRRRIRRWSRTSAASSWRTRR